MPNKTTLSRSAYGEYHRKVREATGLSQKQLADEAGLSEFTVSRWESGRTQNPHHSDVKKVAGILARQIGRDPEQLYDEFLALLKSRPAPVPANRQPQPEPEPVGRYMTVRLNGLEIDLGLLVKAIRRVAS